MSVGVLKISPLITPEFNFLSIHDRICVDYVLVLTRANVLSTVM